MLQEIQNIMNLPHFFKTREPECFHEDTYSKEARKW